MGRCELAQPDRRHRRAAPRPPRLKFSYLLVGGAFLSATFALEVAYRAMPEMRPLIDYLRHSRRKSG
jgi:hypothetical protein